MASVIDCLTQSDGKYIYVYDNGMVARYNSDGSTDNSFGISGVSTDFVQVGRGFYSATLRDDNSIILTGNIRSGVNNIAVF